MIELQFRISATYHQPTLAPIFFCFFTKKKNPKITRFDFPPKVNDFCSQIKKCPPTQVLTSPSIPPLHFSRTTAAAAVPIFARDFVRKCSKARPLKSHWLAFKPLSTHHWWLAATLWAQMRRKACSRGCWCEFAEKRREKGEERRAFSVDSRVNSATPWFTFFGYVFRKFT